jgi:hypothetical protein
MIQYNGFQRQAGYTLLNQLMIFSLLEGYTTSPGKGLEIKSRGQD